MTMVVFWLVVLGGPFVCAAAGAMAEYAFMARRIGVQLDAAYAEGWEDSDARVRAYYGSLIRDAEFAITPGAVRSVAAAVAVAPTLPALPAVHHEGPRHARPQQAVQGDGPDLLIMGVRTRFDTIRMGLGLALPAGPVSQPGEEDYLA